MGHHVIGYDCVCTDCKGSGIYVGMAEKDGFGVVCYKCKGTGQRHEKIEYDDFDHKKKLQLVRVLECNPGIGVGIAPEKGFTEESFGGMPYEDWFAGKPFPLKSEMRAFVCPAWWYQSANYDLKPEWCREYGFGLSSFSSCDRFPQKELCWQRFDKEHKK